jgi:VWFA-related protein
MTLLFAWAELCAKHGAQTPLTPQRSDVLAAVRTYALEYTDKLPDFICTQITFRQISALDVENYIVQSMTVTASDVIEEQLTFIDQKENYEVMAVNRKRVAGVQHTQFTGAISTGEFGSLLHDIFDPRSNATFASRRITSLHGRSEYVFAFDVPKAAGIHVVDKHSGEEIVASYGGLIFVDAETKEVLRIVSHVDFPRSFPMKSAERSVEYARVSIAGKNYSLPFHSEVRMLDATHQYVNRIDYREYHKFEVTSGIPVHAPAKGPSDAKSAAEVQAKPDGPPVAGKSSDSAPPNKTDLSVATSAANQPVTPTLPKLPLLGATAAPMPPPPETKVGLPSTSAGADSEVKTLYRDFSQIAQTAVLRTEVNLVSVPVVVRDAKGRAVGDLTQVDFQLFDKGKRQQITYFTVQDSGSNSAPKTPTNLPGQTPQSVAVIVPSDFVAYWFDDVHLTVGDLARARDAASHNLETLRPADRVAIFTSSGQGNVDFTDDSARLTDALNKLHPHPLSTSTVRQCPEISYYMADLIINRRDANAVEVATADTLACMHLTDFQRPIVAGLVQSAAQSALITGEQENHAALASLKQAVRRLALAPGNRDIIVVSPGFFLSDDLHFDEQEVLDLAVSSRVMISTLDARGLYTLNPAGDIEHDSGSIRSANTKADYARNDASESSALLSSIAAGTGGTFIENTNDLDGGFRRLASPPQYTYLLGFAPENLKSDGKFHPLRVKLTSRQKLSVQARHGYYAANPQTNEPVAARESIDTAIYSRDKIHDLPVELRNQVLRAGGVNATLEVHAKVDLKQLDFRMDAGRHRNDLTVVCVVFDNNGTVVAGTTRVIEMRLRDETVATLAQQTPMDVTSSFVVKPGKYLVRLIVRESAASLMFTENAALDVN